MTTWLTKHHRGIAEFDGESKKCSLCRRRKPLDEFYRAKGGIGGRTGQCKSCANERMRAGGHFDYDKKKRDERTGTIPGRVNDLLKSIKYRAKKRGVECTLTRQWLIERFEAGACEVTGVPFQLSGGKIKGRFIHPFSPSVDRILPGRGYTAENCRLVIRSFNVARADFDDADVLVLARALVARFGKQ